MPALSNMQSQDKEAISSLCWWKSVQTQHGWRSLWMLSLWGWTKSQKLRPAMMDLCSLSAVFVECPPVVCHVVRFEQALGSLGCMDYEVNEYPEVCSLICSVVVGIWDWQLTLSLTRQSFWQNKWQWNREKGNLMLITLLSFWDPYISQQWNKGFHWQLISEHPLQAPHCSFSLVV